MKRDRAIKYLTSAALIVAAALLLQAPLSLYREGVSRRAADPMAAIYTRERLLAALKPAGMALAVAAVLAAAGLALGGGKKEAPRPSPTGNMGDGMRPQSRSLARGMLFTMGLILTIAGCINGGAMDVLIKAIHLCAECIGLG